MNREYTNVYVQDANKEAVEMYGNDLIWLMLDDLKNYIWRHKLVSFTETEEGGFKMEIHISPPEYWEV